MIPPPRPFLAKESGSECKHGGGQGSTELSSCFSFQTDPLALVMFLATAAHIGGRPVGWTLPKMEGGGRPALSSTAASGEQNTALGDSSIDYFSPSVEGAM